MNTIEETLALQMAKQVQAIDKIIQDAFRKHFGKTLAEVKDTENLKHIVVEGSPIESYQYQGQTFLLIEFGDYEQDPYDKDAVTFARTVKFLEV